MARATGLSIPQVGVGQAAPQSVSASALKRPEQFTDGLRVHVQDPISAHPATAISIVDAGGYYTSDEVEGALQEIGAGASGGGGRQNGVLTGCGWTPAGLTITFATPSHVVRPNIIDLSGVSLTLPNNQPSIWVYVDGSTGVLSTQVGGVIPSITSPENILLYKFTTLAGAITASEDLRLYVRNIDRKLPFTVRSAGAQDDQESEACFVTLDAAFNYLKYMTVPLGASRRTEVIVRGDVSVNGPLLIPVSNLQIRGEDNATITLLSGSALFDTNAKLNLVFSDLELLTNTAPASAFYHNDLLNSASISMTRVRVASGGSDWTYGVNVGVAQPARVDARSCDFSAALYGVRIPHTNASTIEGCRFFEPSPGSIGLELGDAVVGPLDAASTVRDCTFFGFTSIASVIKGRGHQISGCYFYGMDGTAIQVETATDILIHGNRIDAQASANGTGIFIYGLPGEVRKVTVSDNNVYAPTNYGILVAGDAQEVIIHGNQIDCIRPLDQPNPSAYGIYVDGTTGFGAVPPKSVTISDNHVWRAKSGIVLYSTSAIGSIAMTDILVSDNKVEYCALGVANPPMNILEFCSGIAVQYASNVTLTGNQVSNIGSILDLSGTVVQPLGLIFSNGITAHYVDRSNVSANLVHDLTVGGVGTSLGIVHFNQPYASWMTPVPAAFDSNGNVFANNTIHNVPGIGLLLYCAAPAAGNAVLAQTVVSSNTVLSTNLGIQVISESVGTLIGQLRVEGNVVEAVLNDYGIELSANQGDVRVVSIVDNTVADINNYGIYAHVETGSMAEVFIDQNQLWNAGGLGTASIFVEGNTPTTFRQISVSGNRMDDPSHILVSVSGIATGVEQLRIDNNTVHGTNSSVALVACAGTIDQFSFCGNSVQYGPYGLSVTTTAAGSLYSANVSNNILVGDQLSTTRLIQLDIDNEIKRVQISGNTISGGTQGINAVGASIDATDVIGNTIQYDSYGGFSYGVRIQTDSTDMSAVRVNDNTLYTTTGDAGGGLGNASAILLQGSTATGVQACGNNAFSSSTLAIGQGIRLVFSDYYTVKVDGNSVNEYQFAIALVGGSTFDNVSASNNTILGCMYEGIHVGFTAQCRNVSINNNNILAYRAVVGGTQNASSIIFFDANSTGDNIEDCSISNNTIRGSYGAGSFLGGRAIRVYDSVNRPDVYRLTVSGNDISYVYRGIVLEVQEARDVNVQGNSLSNIDGHAIYVDSTTTTYNINVASNTVEDWNEDVATTGATFYGVHVASGSNPSGSVTVMGNNLTTTNANAYAYHLDFNLSPTFSCLVCSNNIAFFRNSPAGTVDLSLVTGGNGVAPSTTKNFSFMGNVFRGSSAGILYTGVANDEPDYCTFYGNIGDNSIGNSWSQFASGGTAGWTNVLPTAGVFTNHNIDDGS